MSVKYSFIIPVYNVEKYLKPCVDSILTQEYKDLEVILVDDGSTDRSGAICDYFSEIDKRVIVIHKNNEGVSVARNEGIALSRGTNIIFVDSDDWIDKSYLVTINSVVDTFDLIYYGNKRCYTNGDVISYQPQCSENVDKESIEKRILQLKCNGEKYDYFGYTWNKVFKSEIIKRNGILFVPNLTLREDELFTTQYCKYIKNLKVISTSIYNHRMHNKGLTFLYKDADELLLYANTLFGLIDVWSNQDIRIFSYTRYAFYLKEASCRNKSIIKSIKLAFKAYSIKNKYKKSVYNQANRGVMKLPAYLGILAIISLNVYKRTKRKEL